MKACGYAKYNKFKEHRKDFDALARNVPLSYLHAIGIDMDTLKQCFDEDMEEFTCFREEIPLYPHYATILLHSIVSRNLSFPENITEQEAIELTSSYCSENRFRGCINYPDFKTVWINRDGSVVITFYPPAYRMSRHWLMVKSGGGNMIGMVCIR